MSGPGSLSLSPSPQIPGPAAAAYLAGPAAAGAGPAPDERNYIGNLPRSPQVGPAGYMPAGQYPPNPAGDRLVPPWSLARLRDAGDKGAQAYLAGAKTSEVYKLTGDLRANLKQLISGLNFALEHTHSERIPSTPFAPVTLQEIVDIIRGRPIRPYLRSPNINDPSLWTCDYIFFLDTVDGMLHILKRFHFDSHQRGGIFQILELAMFRLQDTAQGPELRMTTFSDNDAVIPEKLLSKTNWDEASGGRRRRTRRLTKASRYPRSGTRSRARRRVRG